jgi:hypothetical protein
MIQAKQTVRRNRILEKGAQLTETITYQSTKKAGTERPRQINANPAAFSLSIFDSGQFDV